MKKILILFFIIFSLYSNCWAEGNSENYNFVHDYIDCLHTLEIGVAYSEIQTDNILEQKKNINSYLTYLGKAKEFIKPYLGPFSDMSKMVQNLEDTMAESSQVNMIAYPLYTGIDVIQLKVSENLKLLDNISQENVNKIIKNSSDAEVMWGQFFKDSGNILFIITVLQPEDTVLTGKIPRLISENERLNLLKYLERLFGDNFKEHNVKYKQGLIDSQQFSPTVMTYCALHLKKILISETYEDAKVRDELPNPYYFN